MKLVATLFSLIFNTLIGGGLVYAESAYNVCPDWQLFTYVNKDTGTELDIASLSGVWELVEVKTGVDMEEPGEPEFLEVYLEQLSEVAPGGPLIELDGDQITPEELAEVLMNDI